MGPELARQHSIPQSDHEVLLSGRRGPTLAFFRRDRRASWLLSSSEHMYETNRKCSGTTMACIHVLIIQDWPSSGSSASLHRTKEFYLPINGTMTYLLQLLFPKWTRARCRYCSAGRFCRRIYCMLPREKTRQHWSTAHGGLSFLLLQLPHSVIVE
jgi:hypothetical protein